MSDVSKIEWTDRTWNPIIGCSRVSPGCENCYAERFVHRGIQEAHRGLTVIRAGAPGWNGDVRFLPERLAQPQRWRRPAKVFVNSLSDLFHGRVTNEQRLAILGAMLLAPQHTYQILTKRPEYALEFESWLVAESERRRMTFTELALEEYVRATGRRADAEALTFELLHRWWIGVTAEDQKRADERIPKLAELRILPTLRFVSYEPALGPVDFREHLCGDSSGHETGGPQGWVSGPGIDWLIIGGESGPGARPFDVAWARSTIEQARAAGVPVFVKQLGARPIVMKSWREGSRDAYGPCTTPVANDVRLRDRKGGDTSEWPEDLRVREWPEERRA